MASQLLLLGNPRSRRRRRRKNPESRSERSRAARLGWRRRRSSSHRRRNPESTAERSAAARLGWRRRRSGSHRRRNPESFAERSAASRRGWAHRRRYRRNPIETGNGDMMGMLKAGGMLGAGALGVDVIMGMLASKLPASMQTPVDTTTGTTNWGYFAVKLGLALGVVHFGARVMRPDTAEALGVGAIGVTAYGLMRGLIPAGTLPLGAMNPAPIVGAEVNRLHGVRLPVHGVRLRTVSG